MTARKGPLSGLKVLRRLNLSRDITFQTSNLSFSLENSSSGRTYCLSL
jgi:hypothetical protein